jgi:hypothetical protein
LLTWGKDILSGRRFVPHPLAWAASVRKFLTR